MRNTKSKYFVITKDHFEGESLPAKEVSELKRAGYTKHFRLYDDDGELYYSGYLHTENAEKGSYVDPDFIPLYWAMDDSGCTEIHYRTKTGKYEMI